jgi:hypothetical protein
MDNSIIIQLIKFNTEQQIKSRIDLCKQYPTISICREVQSNHYNDWLNFYTKDNYKNLFSKGNLRLNSWINLFKDPPILDFPNFSPNDDEIELLEDLSNKLIHMKNKNPDCYYFIMASLIIIFQVFGDGNHRTANFFYTLVTDRKKGLTQSQQEKITKIYNRNDYYTVAQNPLKVLNNIIEEL